MSDSVKQADYDSLLGCKPNTQQAVKLLEGLCGWPDEVLYRNAKVTELEPFLGARTAKVRSLAASLLSNSADPGPTAPAILTGHIASEKDRDALQALLGACGAYPELRGYLEEQCLAQTKPAAKIGALEGLNRIGGRDAANFFASALGNKKAMRGYLPRSIAADFLFVHGDSAHAGAVAEFTVDMLSYQREQGFNGTLVRAMQFLYKNWSEEHADGIMRAFIFVRDEAWDFDRTLSKEEQWYLANQFEFFSELTLKEQPRDLERDSLNEVLAHSGIGRSAPVPPA